jgi:hypothetical protein
MHTQFLCAVALFAGLLPNLSAQSDIHQKRLAIVLAVKGDATYTVGTVQDAKIRPGLSLPEGARIVTSRRGTVDLYFRQIGTFFRLTPNTDLTLEKLDKRFTDGVVIKETVARLDKGRILTRARVLVPDSVFEVKTKSLVFSVPDAGVGRYDIRANGTVVVGKKSQLPLHVVDVPAGGTNVVSPSQTFDSKDHRAEMAKPEALDELMRELTELDDLAEALTPPPRPEELPKP